MSRLDYRTIGSLLALAAKRRAPNKARRRLSEILGQIDELMAEFSRLSDKAGVGKPGGQATDLVDNAVVEARDLIGDDCDQDSGEWIVAVNTPITREQLSALQRVARVGKTAS